MKRDSEEPKIRTVKKSLKADGEQTKRRPVKIYNRDRENAKRMAVKRQKIRQDLD